jgi:hypothetical protein
MRGWHRGVFYFVINGLGCFVANLIVEKIQEIFNKFA